MKVVVARAPFGIENITVEERSEPERPGPGQLLVRIGAAALNFRDLLVARGEDRWRPPSGRILGSDAAGEVVEVGDGVIDFAAGDRVMSSILPGWVNGPLNAAKIAPGSMGGTARDGVFAEYVLLDAASVVRTATHMTDPEASTLVCAGLTAWHALSKAGLFDGASRSVLVQGTGGVSMFALQIASRAGARVIVTSSSGAKLDQAVTHGASAGINYAQTPSWAEQTLALTGGEGVAHVMDIGGAATLAESIAATAYEGTVSIIGLVGGRAAQVDVASVFLRNIRLQGIETGSCGMLNDFARWTEHERMRPVIAQTYPVSEARAAFMHLSEQRAVGKVCISM